MISCQINRISAGPHCTFARTIVTLLQRSTIQLLRFPFSMFLLPVYLFALSQAAEINILRALLVFLVLHLLVYPSSNGYNSYMDRDELPIGGLQKPMMPTRQLLFVTVIMDLAALLLALFIQPVFALGILLYIAASRAYSYRGIRLKRFPVTGFLTVFIFQGALVYWMVLIGVGNHVPDPGFLCPLIASLLIGALYPLTQVYQHEADKKDGVTTISMVLGKKGSFIFSMMLFLAATFLIYYRFNDQGEKPFYFFLLFMFPVVLFFLYWMRAVWLDAAKADFKNSLRMNIIATACTSAYFITLILMKD